VNIRTKNLTFSSPEVESILRKMSLKANFRLKDDEVANGIHHHHDRVNKNRSEALGNGYRVGDGIFVLSNEEKGNIHLTDKELPLIKPSYTTKELLKWYGNPKNKEWVIYTDSSFKNKSKIEDYPNIKKHLNQFRKVITSDNKPYGLHRSRNESFFKGEKIIVARKCITPAFTFVDFDSYVSATFYVIKSKRIDHKYLVAILNSRLMTFWLKHKGKMQGNNFQIDKEPIVNMPIYVSDKTAQRDITSIVNKLINTLKSKQGDRGRIRKHEDEIDKLVYKLYGLTPEEISIVERGEK